MTGSYGREGTSCASKSLTTSSLPDVQVFLSRPAYPVGGTVVGTVLIQRRQIARQQNDVNEIILGDKKGTLPMSLRSLLESVTVYVAGFCKIDARWHDCSNYTKIYGKTHPYLKLLYQRFDAKLIEQNEDTVCFWATNGMEALDLPERINGRRWRNNETDFQSGLHDDDQVDYSMNDSYSENADCNRINCDILAFTFRVDIPKDLPHSVHATTCRYFYTANVLVKSSTEQRILKIPFRVFASTSSPNEDKQSHTASARVKFSNCFGLAHSNGLPCHLSVTEIQRPKEQIMVVKNHSLVLQYRRRNDVQTLRVSNSSGQPVCVLTVIGSGTLSPGSCVHLRWDFPTTHSSNRSHGWIPCHQVCACLQGEEYAIYEDGSKKRTQSFLFDTCHEWVDPEVTDCIFKTLWLSSMGDDNGENTGHFEGGAPPCDLKTDIMEVSTWCQVDITIQEQKNAHADVARDDGSGYQNLSLRIPCGIRPANCVNDEQDGHDMMEQQVTPLNELLDIETENIAFSTNDIRPDLKTLSLKLNEVLCGAERNNDDRKRSLKLENCK